MFLVLVERQIEDKRFQCRLLIHFNTVVFDQCFNQSAAERSLVRGFVCEFS